MSQIFEVACKQCQAIHDLDQDPGVMNWNCPCVTGEGSTLLKAYWITCSINRRHHYWSNRSEDCKICAEEKANKPIMSVRNEGVSVHGVKVKMADEFGHVDLPIVDFLDKKSNEKQMQESKQDQIIELLKQINQKLAVQEPRELDDK